MNLLAAKRYTKAVFQFSLEQNKIDTVYQDFIDMARLMEESAEFNRFIANPIIPSEKRKAVFKSIFEGKLHGITTHFLLFLDSKNRLNLLKEIPALFEEYYLKHKGIVKAKLISSVSLNTSQVSSISHHLKLKLRKEIEPIEEVDESLIGGIKIQVDDQIYDHSIQTQLKKFKAALISQ